MCDLIIGDDEFDLDMLLNDPDFLNDVDLLNDSPGQGSDPGQGQGQGQDPDPKQKFVEIEQLLMNDDEFEDDESKELLYNVLLDSPVESEASRGEVVDGNGFDSGLNSKASCGEEVGDCDGNGFDSKSKASIVEEVENCDKDGSCGDEEDTKKRNKESEDGEDDDPVSKKRKRYFMIFDDFLDSLIEC